jgi:hypothetical protein
MKQNNSPGKKTLLETNDDRFHPSGRKVNINGFPISADAASEAFDEPLTTSQVLAIIAPFFA